MNELESKHREKIINAPVKVLSIEEQARLVKYIRIVLYNSLTTGNMSFSSEFGPVTFNTLCELTNFDDKDREFLNLKSKKDD